MPPATRNSGLQVRAATGKKSRDPRPRFIRQFEDTLSELIELSRTTQTQSLRSMPDWQFLAEMIERGPVGCGEVCSQAPELTERFTTLFNDFAKVMGVWLRKHEEWLQYADRT